MICCRVGSMPIDFNCCSSPGIDLCEVNTRFTPPQRRTAVGPISTGTPAFSGPSCTHCPSQSRRTRPAISTGSPCRRSVLPPTVTRTIPPTPASKLALAASAGEERRRQLDAAFTAGVNDPTERVVASGEGQQLVTAGDHAEALKRRRLGGEGVGLVHDAAGDQAHLQSSPTRLIQVRFKR